MNKTKIDWPGLTHTWNPVVGCKTGCSYCYGKRLNNRFKWIENWDEPQFYPERLFDPMDKKPSKIFVGSMCDLFGPWIPDKWIQETIEVTRTCIQHEFMFLTKYPKRYTEFKFPENCWLGTSVEKWDGPDGRNASRIRAMSGFYRNIGIRKFISIEPLLGTWSGITFHDFNLIIVGAMTGPGAIKPEKEWIESINHSNVHYKDNIKPYM